MSKADLMNDVAAAKKAIESHEHELSWAEWDRQSLFNSLTAEANVRRWEKRLARANTRLDEAYAELGRWVYAHE